jgi:hypothetical protein
VISSLIGEALASVAPDHTARALCRQYQEPTVLVAEIDFAQLEAQVVFAALLINTFHATFKEGSVPSCWVVGWGPRAAALPKRRAGADWRERQFERPAAAQLRSRGGRSPGA